MHFSSAITSSATDNAELHYQFIAYQHWFTVNDVKQAIKLININVYSYLLL